MGVGGVLFGRAVTYPGPDQDNRGAFDFRLCTLGPLEESLKEAGLTGIRIVPAEATLEELFVQIVRRGEQ